MMTLKRRDGIGIVVNNITEAQAVDVMNRIIESISIVEDPPGVFSLVANIDDTIVPPELPRSFSLNTWMEDDGK